MATATATATSTSTSTSSSFTTHRPALTRPRHSLGNSTINNPSEPSRASSFYSSTSRPGLPSTATAKTSVSAVRSATGRKSLQPLSSSGRLSTVYDGNADDSRRVTHNPNSSPSAMQPLSSPPVNRTVNGDKVGNRNLEVGDIVDVPGGMHGTVKFIGEVKGKKGIFAGVELSREWAARGKNDGDVEGTRYFNTSIPGSGIFLPSSKAYRRMSPTTTTDTYPQTPTNPSLAAFNLGGRAPNNTQTPPTPAVSKLSQSIGPGRAPSPAFRPRSRPSLPRPESPLRRAQNVTSTPHGRPSLGAAKLMKSSVSTARYAPSPTPGKFASSVRADPGKRHGHIIKPDGRVTARPQSRSQSRLGPDPMFDEERLDSAPIGIAKTTDGVREVHHKSRPVSGDDGELQSLRLQLEERDRQLAEQTTSLAEMEKSISELQSSMSKRTSLSTARRSRSSGIDDMDAPQLRMALREKNEKIAMLTADFDSHRADFRSTIDTLEMASTETERVYERRVEDLTQEIRELQDRGDDVESVAQQLKQLEELVQELEEGLEDARRGEAEARGEVEFLRGEVERGRSELRREREKAAAALKGTEGDKATNASSREVEQRDDEIRGLKAIIHSLSRDVVPDMNGSRRGSKPRPSNGGPVNGYNDDKLAEERHAREILEREVKELEGLVDRKTYREEELEHEIERLRSAAAAAAATATTTNHHHIRSISNGFSERTILPSKRSSGRDSKGPLPEGQLESMPEIDSRSSTTDCSHLWCEICDAPGHDILTCTNVFVTPKHNTPTKAQPPVAAPRPTTTSSESLSQRTGRDVVVEGLKGLSMSTPPPPPPPPATTTANHEQQLDHATQQQRSPAPAALNNNNNYTNNYKTLDLTEDNANMVPGKASGVIDASKWCALCERDGHESVDCPFDVDY